MKKIHYLLLLFTVIYADISFAQDGEYITVRDFEVWGSMNLDYEINDAWKINLEEQFRFKNNASEIDAYFTELSTKYEFNKNVFGGIGLRYIRKNDNTGNIQGYENHSRINFDLGYKTEVKRFDFESRLRFQTRNNLDISSSEGDYASNHLRLKTSIAYNIKKWKLDPKLSAEIFRHYEKETQNGFDKFRVTFESKYKLKSYGKIGVFYRVETELNASYPLTSNILGLKYTYTLKNKKK